MKLEDRKKAAMDYLRMVVAGRIEEAFRKYLDMEGKHHNLYNPAGFPALQKGMLENHVQFPDKKITIHKAIGEGNLVAVHSHVVLKAGELELSAVHWFRFQDDKVVELWDCAQQLPANSRNREGAF